MAACTWTNIDPGLNGFSVQGVAASGTATDAPTANEGIACGPLSAVLVTVDCDDTRTLTASTGSLRCWAKVGGTWRRALAFDLAISEVYVASTQKFGPFLGPSAGFGIPIIAKAGRLAWVPDTVPVSAGGLTIKIEGVLASKVT